MVEGTGDGIAPRADRKQRRLRTMASRAMLGCVVAGCFGHREDAVQWAAIVAGSWIGGLVG